MATPVHRDDGGMSLSHKSPNGQGNTKLKEVFGRFHGEVRSERELINLCKGGTTLRSMGLWGDEEGWLLLCVVHRYPPPSTFLHLPPPSWRTASLR